MAFEVEFSKRLDLFGAEIFAALNDKKVALEAQGKKLYNLSVGTPDFEPMPHIKQALCDAAMVSENWKYSLRDLPELLDTVCAYYKRRFDVDGITPDQIMSFNGSQDGMGHMGLALLNDGDVVLLPDPCYPVFITGVKQGGGLPGVHPHNGGLHLLQKALDVCQPPGACAHAHRVQYNRDAAAVCRGTGGAGGGELGFVRGAGVQHNGAGQSGNVGHFLRGLGHDGACPDGQRQVGAVVGRNNVGNAVQKRVLRPDGSQRCGYGHKYKPRVTCSGRSAWISGCRSFPVQTG
jgi:hypothetical protein